MIGFTYLIIAVLISGILIAVYYENYTLGMLSAMGLMAVGVNILHIGLYGFNNLLTLAAGMILFAVGSYIFINGSLEEIQAI